MRALLVPADPDQPTRLVDVDVTDPNPMGQVADLVGGFPVAGRYDLDATILVDDNGQARHRRLNPRITSYIQTESDAARQHAQRGEVFPDTYVIVGDVLLVGPDAATPFGYGDVPQRLIDRFPPPKEAPDGPAR